MVGALRRAGRGSAGRRQGKRKSPDGESPHFSFTACSALQGRDSAERLGLPLPLFPEAEPFGDKAKVSKICSMLADGCRALGYSPSSQGKVPQGNRDSAASLPQNHFLFFCCPSSFLYAFVGRIPAKKNNFSSKKREGLLMYISEKKKNFLAAGVALWMALGTIVPPTVAFAAEATAEALAPAEIFTADDEVYPETNKGTSVSKGESWGESSGYSESSGESVGSNFGSSPSSGVSHGTNGTLSGGRGTSWNQSGGKAGTPEVQ